MNGRGRGSGHGGRGRGGRGHAGKGASKSSSLNSPTKKERKGLSDYIYYIGSAKQVSDCSLITQYLINHVRRTYTNGDDIGEALEKREELDTASMKPRMGTSIIAKPGDGDDPTAYNRELKEIEILYEAEVSNYVERVRMYDMNKGSLCFHILTM